MAARNILEKLGGAALRFQQVGQAWHKPAISAKNLARLRREALLAGEEWQFDKPAKEARRRKPKGHKHDREKPLREAAVQQKLGEADKRIADYRASRQAVMKDASLMDRLLLSPKQIREKAKTGA